MNFLGGVIRSVSPSAANWINRYRRQLFPPREIYALGPLHQKIEKCFPFRNGFFFEVGANDGFEQSNTAYLERYRGWRGILVEPLPAQFAKCRANRPRATVINAALVSEAEAGKCMVISDANLMSMIDDAFNIISHDGHVQRFGGKKHIPVQSHTVSSTTVSRILDNAGNPAIDFFSLDVEGYELEVMRGIDFARHRPRYFLVEVRNLDATDEFLSARNYARIAQWSHHDFLYKDLQLGVQRSGTHRHTRRGF